MITLTIVIVNGIAIKFLRHLRALVDGHSSATPCGWGVGKVLASNFSLWALRLGCFTKALPLEYFSAGRYDPWQVKLGMVIFPLLFESYSSTRCIPND